jgi:hypothetical protein
MALGAVVGAVLGYFAGVALFCLVLTPSSNLCGIIAVVTAPVGAVVGALLLRRALR